MKIIKVQYMIPSLFSTDYLYQQSFVSFRKYCLDSETLPVDLHIIISDILQVRSFIFVKFYVMDSIIVLFYSTCIY